MPTISPARTVSETSSTTGRPVRRSDGEALDAEQRPGGSAGHVPALEVDGAAGHVAGDLGAVGLRGHQPGDGPPVPEHGDVVAELEDLAQLVRDDDDGATGVAQPAQHVEEQPGLLRRQHGGRLVEDQHLRLAVQRLQDLDPLEDADREVPHPRPGVDLEPVPLGELLHGPHGRAAVEQAAGAPRLGAVDDVLGHRHRREQPERLVHHAHPGGDGLDGRAEGDRPAVDPDLALVRRQQAVEHRHQGGLAGPVLPDQRVDLAGREPQVRAVVGDDVAETLDDAGHLHPGRARRSPGGPGRLSPRRGHPRSPRRTRSGRGPTSPGRSRPGGRR